MTYTRRKNKNGFGSVVIAEMLKLLLEERRANYIYLHSPYKFKNSSIRLLHWLLAKDLIKKRTERITKKIYFDRRTFMKSYRAYYQITEKGRNLLDLLC